MARTESTMLELGTQAPDFSLPEPVSGKQINLSDYSQQPLLVVFSCNHCPFVLHILHKFAECAADYQARGVSVVMINANDVDNYEADSPKKMVELVDQVGLNFPYLYDESQQVAMSYRAACTPDFFLFDQSHQLFYRGQFDDARPGNEVAVTGSDLTAAIDALLQGKPAPQPQIPSLGCNIKWKAGNEPDYF